MSVLIRGMEMPKDGVYWCEIGVADDIAMITIHGEDRKSFPLVPVPLHGDLIDRREAIIDANERAYDFWLSDDEVNATIRFLNEQTAIIKAEDNNAIP